MPAFKIKKEIKEEILAKVKAGVGVADVANQHGVSTKTIYGWLSGVARGPVTFVQYAKVRRERDELLKIVGAMQLKAKLGEKNRLV